MSPSAPIIRVAVVEDRTEELFTLVTLLRSAAGFSCAAACSSALEALEELPPSRPDVVLMDIQMPGLSGIECVRQLRPLLPATQIMMLTVVEDHDLIFRSLAAGANGYLLKKTPGAKILEGIRELHAGGAPMSGQIARKVVAAFRGPPAESPAEALSTTEQSVLRRLARGLLYKEVAAELNMSVSTVRTHVWHIYRKLQVHNRTEAILKGLPNARS
jgi:DNA-binding NarL/FixJ family response regulator